MGQHGMVKMYDELTGAPLSGSYKSVYNGEEVNLKMSAAAHASIMRNRKMGKKITLLDNSKFAGNYNIPHIIRQIKVYLKNGTEIDKYQKKVIEPNKTLISF